MRSAVDVDKVGFNRILRDHVGLRVAADMHFICMRCTYVYNADAHACSLILRFLHIQTIHNGNCYAIFSHFFSCLLHPSPQTCEIRATLISTNSSLLESWMNHGIDLPS